MKTYIIRSVKYFIALCVLYVLCVSLMKQSQLTYGEYLQLMFATWRGYALVGVTVLLALTYPYFGFIKREVDANFEEDRSQIISAFSVNGFDLIEETQGKMVFRASGLKRITMLFEDKIEVEENGATILMSGLRREAVKVILRMNTYITNKRRANA